MISLHLAETRVGAAGRALTDLTPHAEQIELCTNLQGDSELIAAIRWRDLQRQFMLLDHPGGLDLEAWAHGACVWRGRMEEAVLSSDAGLRLTAYGPQRALADVPYTALWSDDSVAGWRDVVQGEFGGIMYADRFTLDRQNRLYIAPKKDITYSWAFGGAHVYTLPSGSATTIGRVSFSWQIVQPAAATWEGRLSFHDAAGATLGSMTYMTGPGPASGSTNVAAPANAVSAVVLLYHNNAGAKFAGEDGSVYMTCTNVRVTTATPPITASAIAQAMAAHAAGANGNQLSADVGGIAATTRDYTNEIYEDATPARILDTLAQREQHTWRVGRDRRLAFFPNETSPYPANHTHTGAWRVDLTQIELERVMSQLTNSAYGVYADASGRTLRTAVAADASSVYDHGAAVRRPVSIRTTSQTLAEAMRDVALADGKRPAPRAAIVFRRVTTMAGAPVHPTQVAGGDVLLLGGLPGRLSASLDQIAVFQVARTRLTLARGARPVLAVEPLDPPQTLEVLLARHAAGVA